MHNRRGKKQWQAVRREGEAEKRAPAVASRSHDLPIYARKQQILQHIHGNTLTFVQGESGCGKSVGVPQMILDDARVCHKHVCILVAEPHSDQAESLARYVASLRCFDVGAVVQYAVNPSSPFQHGHHQSCLTYVTSSQLFKWLLYSEEVWHNMTHLILDDVDTRTIDQDLLYLLIKLIFMDVHVSSTRNKRIVIMSGKLSQCPLFRYFSFLANNKAYSPIFINIKTAQPWKVVYLEDFTKEMPTLSATAKDMVNTLQKCSATGRNIPHIMFDLVREIVLNQAHPGDIFLVLLPGMGEVNQLEVAFSTKPCQGTFKVGLLIPHLGRTEQQEVLQSSPEHVNVIIATQFVERNSIISRVNYVIDFGMKRVFSFNRRRGMNVLSNEWTSKFSLRQRAVKFCCNTVFRLFTRRTYESLQEDADTEMKMSCLSQPLLQIKAHMHTLGSVDNLFQQLLDPPGKDNLIQTIKSLNAAGAIEGQSVADFSLTQLGRLAAALSVDVEVARLIVLGLLLCCSTESVIIAAGLISPVELFKRPSFQSGFREESKVQQDELSYFKGKKSCGGDMCSDMITFCNVYRNWLKKSSWEAKWISESCINIDALNILVRNVQFLASGLAMFMEKEQLVEIMRSEYYKILGLRGGDRTHQAEEIFCDDVSPVLLSITGAFITNVIVGKVANTALAHEESREITMAGLNPINTFKLSNIPQESLDDTETYEEALQVLGSISKVLVLKDHNCALVECCGSVEEEQQFPVNNLPEAAKKAYFLASQRKQGGLQLTLKKGMDMKSVYVGSISRERQVFWSTYVKGKRYGIIFDKCTNLPQHALGLHTQEEFIVAVAAGFIGADNSKVYVSATTLLPSDNYFSITALLLFRPFQAYLIRTDNARKHVYSLQYGPMVFHFSPQYILLEQLHLVEEIRKKLNKRALESQLCEGYKLDEILHLLRWVASQKHCEPHLNPAVEGWQEYPSFKPIDVEKYSLTWKLNMTSRDGSVHTNDLDKVCTAQEPEESCLLKSLRMVEPDLGKQYLEEWLDGNKELNPVFYSFLERLIAAPELQQQACVVLRFMHKKCDELVQKRNKMQLEGWYHSLCNPVLWDEFSQNSTKFRQAQKIYLQRHHAGEGGIQRMHLQSHENYLPMVSRIMSLTASQINTLRHNVKTNANQVKILFPQSQSQTDNVVIFGHPEEVEAAMQWIELISTGTDTRKFLRNGLNRTYFVPERPFSPICCTELGPGDKLYAENSYRGMIQFYVQGCIDKQISTLQEMELNLGKISQDIKRCIAGADKSLAIEIQARLGRVIFQCSENKKDMLSFQRTQDLEKLSYSLQNKTFTKQYFSDTVTKEEHFYIKACLRLFKSISIRHEKKITIFLQDQTDNRESDHVKKITIKDSNNGTGHFELAKLQQKERLAVIDLVHLKLGHVKADIRLSVQGYKDEHIDECYREFVSNIQWDGVKLKFPKYPFDVTQQRIKNTEEYAYDGFSVSLSEITQVKGNTCLQKYEVEISPIYLGKSLFSAQELAKNLDTFLPRIVAQAHSISTYLLLSQALSSSMALAHAIMCLWKTGKRESSDLKHVLLHHVSQDSELVQAFTGDKKEKFKALMQFDIATLVEILWQLDGLDFSSINLSESLLSFLFRSLQHMKIVLCESLNKRAQEIISRQGFPPRLALAYASLFECHCLGYYEWARILSPHYLELITLKPQITKEFCFSILNLSTTCKPFELNLSLERILPALGRHWADRNPRCFLQMYGLALKEQDCSTIRILIEDFVRQLFVRNPFEAAMFVLSTALCFINDLVKERSSAKEVSAALIRLLELIKELKAIVTEGCRILALNILVSLEAINNEVQEIERKVFEVYEIDEATFRHYHYQKILSTSLPLKAIHLKELERRGLTYDFCEKMDLKSWMPGKHVASSCLIPGLNKEGNKLIGSPGIFIPARDPSGHILGAQIKADQPTTGKYKWLSSNNVFVHGRGPSINNEWPLFCCTSSFRHTSTLGMCEGGLKAHVLSFLGALPVIGASGAAFPKSRKLLERYLAVMNPDQIIFFPDAGSQCNDQVSRVYFQTFRLIREFGYYVLIAWWGQVSKTDHEDIDDLLCNGKGDHSIPLISPSEFWYILLPAVRKKLAIEFPEYSGSCGVSKSKNEEAFIDEDEIEVSRSFNMHQGDRGNTYDEYLISIPKRIMKSMPPPPNDLVTPKSLTEFTLQIRMVKLFNFEIIDSCVEWMLQDIVKSTACLGLHCHYDSQCNLCLLELSVHQRCVLIQIPSCMKPQVNSIKLQSLLLDKGVVKAGVSIDRDALHIYHCLLLKTNNCIKLSQHSAANRQKPGLLDMFRKLFDWEWHEKDEVGHSNWRLNSMTLEQIKFAALSAWSCHLIWAQKKERLDDRVKSFCLDEVPHQLLDYFQRSLMNIEAYNNQSNTSIELTDATVEIQQGFLILNPNNVRSKALGSNCVVEVSFKDGRKPEEYTTKRVGDKNVLVHKGTQRLQESEVDVSSINKLIVDKNKCPDMQKQKLEDAIHSLLCNPAACPPHILMGLRCLDMGGPVKRERSFSPPQGLILNRFQLDAAKMMLSNPLCAVIGPPGTGKTRVITGVAKIWEQSTPQGHILLCAAQQNVAVRHMAETMVKNKVQGVMLLISKDYFTDWRQEEYKHIEDHIVVSGPDTAANLKAWTDRNKRQTPRILLCTFAQIGGSSFYICVKNCNILYMIIDESSQAAEGVLISSLVCLPYLQRLSVLGDPCQLPPFGNSVQSVFDLVSRNCKVITLQIQYRMPKSIAEFVSQEFYGGQLRTLSESGAADHCTALLWVDVCGSPKTAVGSTSLCNEKEAEAIMMFCKTYNMPALGVEVASSPSTMSLQSSFSLGSSSSLSLSSSYKSSKSGKLVVLILYEAQRLLISKMLADNQVEGVDVHNVDSFQGQEAEIILISLVVGGRMSPFASDRRRACVLLSRAKCALYMFGSLEAMKNCSDNTCNQKPIIWKSLALECQKHDWVARANSISEMNFSALLT